MKKFILVFLLVSSPVFAGSIVETWVSDVVVNNGHVTYTFNTYMPIENDMILAKNRRDYICSQNKEAVLWGTATYLTTGKTVDYTKLIDPDKLRKYGSLNEFDMERIQQIIPYCR